jgi:hypothetical protein
MTKEHTHEAETTTYTITVEGQLGSRWAQAFEGMTLTTANRRTVIHGPVADQAALHGLLRIIRDLGLELVSVTRSTTPGQP